MSPLAVSAEASFLGIPDPNEEPSYRVPRVGLVWDLAFCDEEYLQVVSFLPPRPLCSSSLEK